jgi:uncharacterized C2H2 Zn-finger protein
MTYAPPVAPETEVDGDESPARCPHCGRPFRTERRTWLHVGERHRDDWTGEERAAHERAREAEADDLFVFHLQVVGLLGLLYASFVIVYMVALAAG